MKWSTRAAPVPAHSARSGSVRPLVAGVVILLVTGLSPARAGVAAPPEAAPSATEPASVPDELLVGYRHGVSETRRSDARSRARAERVGKVADESGDRPAVELVKVNGIDRAEATRRFKSNPDVAFAEPNWVYTHDSAEPIDTKYADGSLWGMYGDRSTPNNAFGSQAAEAWAAEKTGSDTVYVGIIDEGYDYEHPDLTGNAGKNPGESVPPAFETDGIDNDLNGFIDDVRGWDFANNDKGVYDYPADSHGTHVAGTIGATNNGSGVVGVSWNVSLLSGKFLGPLGGTTANAIKAVDYFTKLKTMGVNVVATNNSWSGGGFSQGLKDAIANAGAQNILFVAAAGNANANTDTTLTYPSGYDLPNVVSVAAIDKLGNRASFSNYGVKTVDLGAPGVGIWSTQPGNTYGAKDGTSMAAPHVTGAVALYAATYPARLLPEIRAALLGTVIATPALAGKTVTGGRLDVSTLLSGVIPPPPPPPPNPRVVTVTQGKKGWTGTPITLRWTGYTVKVDIYRNGSKIVTNTTNDGLYTQTVRGPGTFLYKVCDTGKTAGSSCAEAPIII